MTVLSRFFVHSSISRFRSLSILVIWRIKFQKSNLPSRDRNPYIEIGLRLGCAQQRSRIPEAAGSEAYHALIVSQLCIRGGELR